MVMCTQTCQRPIAFHLLNTQPPPESSMQHSLQPAILGRMDLASISISIWLHASKTHSAKELLAARCAASTIQLRAWVCSTAMLAALCHLICKVTQCFLLVWHCRCAECIGVGWLVVVRHIHSFGQYRFSISTASSSAQGVTCHWERSQRLAW
jgi:hypothetical protein